MAASITPPAFALRSSIRLFIPADLSFHQCLHEVVEGIYGKIVDLDIPGLTVTM